MWPADHNQSMSGRKDVTVPLPENAVDEIDETLSYGDSRAGWIREAVYQRLEREGVDTEEYRKELGELMKDKEGNSKTAPGTAPTSD